MKSLRLLRELDNLIRGFIAVVVWEINRSWTKHTSIKPLKKKAKD